MGLGDAERMRVKSYRAWGRVAAAGAFAAVVQSACMLPVRLAPAVTGRVIDAETGAPLSDALVVVRIDGRYHEFLPDRDLLAHLEARTDNSGRFLTAPLRSPGLSAWPLLRTEAQVVAVLLEGYQCAQPRPVRPGEPLEIRLTSALDEVARRESCHPLPVRSGEAVAYLEAWRSLFPAPSNALTASDREMDRVLAARSVLGFGENCEGPVLDLALAPGGVRAALLVTTGRDIEVHALELADGHTGVPVRVGREPRSPPRRLAWTSPLELVLWEPASAIQRSISPSRLAMRSVEWVWTAPGARSQAPAAPALGLGPDRPRAPLDPADLNDEGDALWLGRSFSIRRSPDPATGLGIEKLRITRRDGTTTEVEIPGEACGPVGRFGRPHDRIAAGGRWAIDLRFVEHGCHAVAIDLETGDWVKLDRATEKASCRDSRRISAAHLRRALRGYSRELEAALSKQGADPTATYSLQISGEGAVTAQIRDFAGRLQRFSGPRFPVRTPLRRIEVVGVAATGLGRSLSSAPGPEPL